MLSKAFDFSMVKKIDWLVAVWLTVLVIATSWSLFQPTFFRVHDYVHGARIAELTRSAQAGHLPVRWTENFGYGYGMPLFEFYAPLPYYIGGFIYWVTGNLVLASKVLFLIPNLGAVMGGYLLGRALYGRKGGVIVATAFALAPYRAVNLFVRGAVSESWGMMAMPFILWAGIRWVRSFKTAALARGRWLWLVGSLVVLFLSHNLSTLMFVPVSLLFLSLVGWQELGDKNWKRWFTLVAQLALAYLLAVGLTAFYLVPALVEKDFTIISNILSGYFFYSHHFLYIRQLVRPNWGYGGSAWGPDDGLSFFLGYGQLVAVVGSALASTWHGWQLWRRHGHKPAARQLLLLRQRFNQTHHFQLFVVSGLFVAGALYLTLLKSEWLWQNLPLISYIQFPWRWLSIAALFLALMAGYGAVLVQGKRNVILLVVGLLFLLGLNAQYFRPESFLGTSDDFYYADAERIRTQMSGILPDYIPVDLKLAALATPEQATPAALLAPNSGGKTLTPQTEAAIGEYSVSVARPHQKAVSVNLTNPTELVFATAAYPGWRAEIDGQPAALTTTTQGLLSVTVPAGSHLVGLDFGSTPVRFVSDSLSLFSFVVLIYLTLPRLQFKTKK